jgi:4-amino-4-deoxychorismate lyase
MSLLFETIRIQDGKPQNLEYHNFRLNQSRRVFYNSKDTIDLTNLIAIPDDSKKGIVKCKVLYSKDVEEIRFEIYTPRKISSLKLIEDNTIEYSFKFTDREKLNKLFLQKGDSDDILIIKNGFVTDTSYSNIIFHNGFRWITPASPLLLGTMRKRLIDTKFILEKDIKAKDIPSFQKVRLINAMLPFETAPEIKISQIDF